jgi:choline dehydrogenase-like flavoprotein
VTSERADVLVVGAGASGGALAWRLARAGVRVVCLEQGDWVGPADSPTTRDDWEVRRQREWHPNPNVRGLATDYPVDDAGSPIQPLMFNGVGGSTIMWSSHVPRFHPSDFRTRTLDGVGDDWPVDYVELEPYYDLNDRMMGVAGLAGDPANPPRSPRQTPPVPLGEGARRLAGAFDRLGWHWWPSDVAINTVPYGEGRGSCNNCGPCELYCPHEAKAHAAIAYWPGALAAGARLVTRARVAEVTVDERGRATGAAYYDADGALRHQPASVVVLAANGIGTPRLMLLSTSRRFPDGLANGSGLVGRRLMHHPIAFAIGVFDDLLQGHRGITACSILCQEFYETDPARDFVRGYELQVTRSHGPLITALGGFGLDVPWGEGHHRRFAEVFDRTVGIAVTAEDLADEANTVTLADGLADAHGVPAPRLTYRLDANAERMLAHGLDRAAEALTEAGAREVLRNPLFGQAGFHLMGTARMGDDPETSVVDPFGRAHEVPNLFVVDGSAFVTAAAVNPTPTIQALALRTADHLVQERRAMPVGGAA